MDINFEEIISASPEDLYRDGMKNKLDEDYTGYCLRMTMSANLKYEPAMKELANDYYDNNIHLKQDLNKTRPFYERTSQYGYSANYLGYLYRKAEEIEKAIDLYKIAITKENRHAMYNLACVYLSYQNPRDYTEIIRLFEMAISHGDSLSYEKLSDLYLGHYGYNKVDRNRAKEYLIKALKQKRMSALDSLQELIYDEVSPKRCRREDFMEILIELIDPLILKTLFEENIYSESTSLNEEIMTYLILLYKLTNLKEDVSTTIKYFCSIDRADVLNEIYELGSHLQEQSSLKERVSHLEDQLEKANYTIEQLQQENDELKVRISLLPNEGI